MWLRLSRCVNGGLKFLSSFRSIALDVVEVHYNLAALIVVHGILLHDYIYFSYQISNYL